MDATSLIVTLALLTLGAGAIFALVEKERTERRKADPNAPKSTLASDTANTTRDGRAPD